MTYTTHHDNAGACTGRADRPVAGEPSALLRERWNRRRRRSSRPLHGRHRPPGPRAAAGRHRRRALYAPRRRNHGGGVEGRWWRTRRPLFGHKCWMRSPDPGAGLRQLARRWASPILATLADAFSDGGRDINVDYLNAVARYRGRTPRPDEACAQTDRAPSPRAPVGRRRRPDAAIGVPARGHHGDAVRAAPAER